MKHLRIALVLLAVASLGIIACHRQPKGQSGKEVVVLDKGQLSFFDLKSKMVTPFEAETDSVINMVFADKDHLYYTVSKEQNLSLKMIDLSQTKPEPKLCADWDMTIDEALDFMYGNVMDLHLDEAGEHICFYKLDEEGLVMNNVTYNIKSREVKELEDDETIDLYYGDKKFNPSHCYPERGQFYYVTTEGNTCLSDKIDFKTHFNEDDNLEELDFVPVVMSPDQKKMVFTAVVYDGEGWGYYCVANTDGSSQELLGDSDIWDQHPEWLLDGSLVYIGKEGVKLVTPQKETFIICLGQKFATRPFLTPERNNVRQPDLEGCDVAFLDNGKVTFYSSLLDMSIPYVVEEDSVINGAFVGEDMFYYTVSIGNNLYLKRVYLGVDVEPTMVTDWELQLEDCVSETYGKASELNWIPNLNRIGINHNFSWDFYDFSDIRFYDLEHQTKIDGWLEGELETDDYNESLMQSMEDYERFHADGGNYYYTDGDQEVCISDKINFRDYVSDPEYFAEPEFEFYSIDPTRTNVAYAALIEWGDLGHGPLCLASLDGKMQVAFKNTDAANLNWGWLGNGALLYVGKEPRSTDDPEYDEEWNTTQPCVKVAYPDGSEEVLSHSSSFVVKGR